MKPFLFFTSLLLSLSLAAQAGSYTISYNTPQGDIRYALILKEDSSFTYHFYRFSKCASCRKENYYAKGKWLIEKKIIYFSSSADDMDDTYTLNFNNSKAHFIKKSPRDKTDRVIPEALHFYESEISWVKGMKLLKD